MDYFAGIHIRTNLHDIIRVPVYYHVHSDLIKFTPAVLDFGLVPLNFDLLKLPIRAKSSIKETIIVNEALVPINDRRLDFLLMDFKGKALEKGLKRNQEVFLGYVIFNPYRTGFVESKIIITFLGTQTNKTYQMEVPIIGYVHENQNFFGNSLKQNETKFPTPLITFDVADYI